MHDDIHGALASIQPLSPEALSRAQAHLDNLTKPPGSLGKLEELARRYVAIKGSAALRKKSIFVFAADHGVTAEKVSAYPAEVTPQMVLNFLNGGAAINVLARHAGAEVIVVDIGVNHDFGSCPGLIDQKIAFGTGNMARGPAMTRQQAEQSLNIGIKLAAAKIREGADVLCTGDMGIGNTTAATAVFCVYGKRDPSEICGRGTGIDDEILSRKISVLEKALNINRPDPEDPIDVLAKVGGFEIGAIAGTILGAAAHKTPVIIDGLISGAGAILAAQLKDDVRDYIFTSHLSQEPAHKLCFDLLKQPHLFDLEMRLGEGTGAALALLMLEAGTKIYSEMASFQQAGVSGKTKSS